MNRIGFWTTIAALATAASAFAQPGTFTNLGSRLADETFTTPVTLAAANDVQWFRIELGANSATDGYCDIYNEPSGLADNITDSEIGIYNNAGALVATNDDGGPSLYSQLSHGLTAPARPANTWPGTTIGLVFSGQNGPLAGGVYWVAVAHFNATFAAGWTVTSTYTGTQRSTLLTFRIVASVLPIPPSGTGTATPNSGVAGASFVAAVAVSPGANPPSTGLTVSLDASLVGGGTVTLLDDGVAPDAVAGDNTFTGDVTTSGATPTGPYSLPFTITDAEARSGGGNIAYSVIPPPPPNDDCGTAAAVGLGSTPFDSTSATNDGLVVTCQTSSRDIWFSYTPASDITVDIDTCAVATTFDTVVSVHDSCGGAELYCDDDSCVTPTLASLIEDVSIAGGSTVYIRVARFTATATAGGPGLLTITEVVPPTPPDWDEAVNGGGDAGDTIATAQTVAGSGTLDDIAGDISAGDADLYRIEICDPANFRASTRNDLTAGDTQLFLFDSTGLGIVQNDDDPDPAYAGLLSTISNAFTNSLPSGEYYLAISRYDNDPIDAAAASIWLDTPFDTERAPDGPGAGNPIDGWTGGGGTGVYRIELIGACFVSEDSCPCDGDLDGNGSVDITDLALFLSSFGTSAPGIPTPCADIDGNGSVDITDLALFLSNFGTTCP